MALGLCVVCSMATTATAANLIENPNFASDTVTEFGTSMSTWGKSGAKATGWTLNSGMNYLFRTYDTDYYELNGDGPYWSYLQDIYRYGGVAPTTEPFRGESGVRMGNNADATQVNAHFLKSDFYIVFSVDQAPVVGLGGASGTNVGTLTFSLLNTNGQAATLINENGEEVTSITFGQPTADDGWQTVTSTFVVKESGDYRVRLVPTGGGLFLTNASLEMVVPEPGTWAMLAGLGVVGAAWYRRRRK